MTEDSKFEAGRIVTTPGVVGLFNLGTLVTYLKRHITCDWGDIPKEDAEQNDKAVKNGGRLLSAYKDAGKNGETLWIITDADRSVTTFLLPEEY